MIDHLLTFADEAAAIAALPEWRVDGQAWDSSSVLAGQRLITSEAVYGTPDPDTGEMAVVTPAIIDPGYFVTIGLPVLDAGLAASALAVRNRDTGEVVSGTMPSGRLEPMFA